MMMQARVAANAGLQKKYVFADQVVSLGVGLGPPVLLYLQPLTLPHRPSGGD